MFEIHQLRFKNILHIERLLLSQPICCIVGASGSGKTTLLRHLNRLYVPDEGEILYNGTNLGDFDPVQLRRRIVMLGQSPVIYDGTIADNLQVGLLFSQKKPARSEDLRKILQQVGLRKSPKDYCDRLSGGEKQRLCLARVLLMDAEVYLMDEPSAALDHDTELFIMKNLATHVLKQNKQLIMVTHSEQLSGMYADSCIRLGTLSGGEVS